MKILKYSYLVAISLTLLFAGCSDSPTDSEEEPTMYEVNISASPSQGGSVSPTSKKVETGDTLKISAAAADGYTFDGWSGDYVGDDNPVTITVASNKDITANFVKPSIESIKPQGEGTEQNPYKINSLENLVWISADTSRWSNHYQQTQNIDASATSNSSFNDGKGFSPIGNQSKSFTGSYDGQGYTISNLYINRPDANRIGFFGAASAMITNVHLVGADITGSKYSGALVGFNFDIISQSSVSGSLQGGISSGGIVGACINGGKIISSYNTASVTGKDDLSSNNANRIGGIIGIAKKCTIRNTYNTGDVRGPYQIGGIAGEVENATIENTYNAGSVDNKGDENKDQNGGIVGVAQGGTTFTNNYYDKDVTGSTVQNGDIGGTGKSTPDMMEQGTFNGWDFGSIWAIDSGTYPYLQNNTQEPHPGS